MGVPITPCRHASRAHHNGLTSATMSVVGESAVAAYGGYEYQIVVTVWVALDLVIVREWCDAIEVEPASQEDIAADLIVLTPAAEAVETVVSAESNDGRVEIQIKRRSRFWSVSDFTEMVETPAKIGSRGPAPRERALARLKTDAQLRYLLITDAEVHPNLKEFVVEQIGCASKATDASLGGLSPGQAVRIGIREKRVQELVEREIDDILERGARVPLQKVRDCRAALIERVRDRLLGKRGARLDRSELEGLVALHGGFPPSASDEFVPPAGFDDLRRHLGEPPFALVLVGPPGIGKTLAAEKIVEEHRRADRPFEIMKNPAPHEIRAEIMQPGRTLFYLEDPWGRYKLAEDAAMWNDELPRLIRGANANSDKRFLVTSRTGVLQESIDLSPQGRDPKSLQRKLSASVVSIVEADFDGQDRSKIVRLWMRGAKRWQRDWVEDRLKDIVAKLTVPQALSVFAHAVKSTQNAADLQLDRLLAESQVAAIGDMVIRQVRELRAVAAGVTLWAFLSVGERLTHAARKELAMWLGEAPHDGADLPRLVEHLTANGWLTDCDGLVTAHPTVIEGLERLADEESTSCHRVLQSLFSVLVREGRVEIVARLLRGLSGRNMPIPTIVRTENRAVPPRCCHHRGRLAARTCDGITRAHLER